jgi:hypothetical protein
MQTEYLFDTTRYSKPINSPLLLSHIVLILLTLVLVAIITPRIVPAEHPNMDLNKYRTMASAAPGIADDVPRPFAYRLLGPYMAGLLPIDTDSAFLLISLSLSVILLVLFYSFLCRLGIDPRAALLVTVLYSLNYYQFSYHIYNFFQVVDLLTLVLVIVLLWAMLSLRWMLFAVALVVGAVCRETPLIMVPVALVFLIERRLVTAEGLKLLLAVIPAVVVFVSMRFLIPYSGGMGLIEALTVHISKFKIPTTWLNIFVRPFTPLTFLAIVYMREFIDFYKRRLHLVCLFALVAISTAFGTDTERLMAPAFVVFYIPLAMIIQSKMRENRVFMAFLIVVVAARAYYYLLAPDVLPTDSSERIAATLPAVIVAIAGYWVKIRNSRKNQQAESLVQSI